MTTIRLMTKSPRAVAREVLRLAQEALPAYSFKFSPKDFTQHQLFALLALKTFFKTDYPGLIQLLRDFAELRQELGLNKIPHYSTLCYAQQRLLKKGRSSCSSSRPPRAKEGGLIGDEPEAAIDGTGLESRHTSQYFFKRAGHKQSAHTWMRLTSACDMASHFFTAATVSVGPANDSPQFRPAMTQAALGMNWARVLADAAFDSEENHRLAREDTGVRSTVIPLNRRIRGRKRPKTRYRRQMVQRFRPRRRGSRQRRVYGQHWQVESAFSRHKRLLGSALPGRSDASRQRECNLRVSTQNIILLAATGKRVSTEQRWRLRPRPRGIRHWAPFQCIQHMPIPCDKDRDSAAIDMSRKVEEAELFPLIRMLLFMKPKRHTIGLGSVWTNTCSINNHVPHCYRTTGLH
jgi:hypothetical protein